MKLYLDTCHLIKLLDRVDPEYKELSKFICENKVDLLISDFILTELFQANNESLYKRSIEAKKYNFLFLKSNMYILQLEIESYKNKTPIEVITKNMLEVLPVPNPELFPDNKWQITFDEFLMNQPQVKLPEANHNLYNSINLRKTDLRFKDSWKNSLKNYLNSLSLEEQRNIKPQHTPSYTFYIYSWCINHNDYKQQLTRNDLFDTRHCSYIPYADGFITDNGNASVAKSSLQKLNNDYFNFSIKTRIFKSPQDFLKHCKSESRDNLK
jgi:hypothetical protein